MGILYEAINKINGKKYIGISERTLARRVKAHIDHAIGELRTTPFHAAIRKYGRDGFTWHVITELPTRYALQRAEVELIAQHRADGVKLYNVTSGGDGAVGFTPEMRKRIADKQRGREAPNKGVPHTEETRRKISAAKLGVSNPKISAAKKGIPNLKLRGRVAPNKGVPHSEETRLKISASKRRKQG